MLIMVLYSVTISAINTKDNIEDKIELNQQAEEMEYHIKNIVENSINIINMQLIKKFYHRIMKNRNP